MPEKKKILSEIENYYTQKVLSHGDSPQGVDWNSSESQELRFKILSQVIAQNKNFSVLDYGCGYGAMFSYYKLNYDNFKYTGFDISDEMIKKAKENHKTESNANWFNKVDDIAVHDFVIASGIFNVRLKNSDNDWEIYIFDTLNQINKLAERGFAFNMLTSYSDKEYMKDYLYYADPRLIFDYCKKNFSKNIALLHDYDLYEFTIIVRK